MEHLLIRPDIRKSGFTRLYRHGELFTHGTSGVFEVRGTAVRIGTDTPLEDYLCSGAIRKHTPAVADDSLPVCSASTFHVPYDTVMLNATAYAGIDPNIDAGGDMEISLLSGLLSSGWRLYTHGRDLAYDRWLMDNLGNREVVYGIHNDDIEDVIYTACTYMPPLTSYKEQIDNTIENSNLTPKNAQRMHQYMYWTAHISTCIRVFLQQVSIIQEGDY